MQSLKKIHAWAQMQVPLWKFFVRNLFLGNFAYANFRENKTLGNGKITLSFIDIGTSCLSHELFTSLIYVF